MISMVNLSLFTLKLNLLKGWITYIQNITMLQNKIYQNYFIEILKTFLVIVLGLSLIALTVRAVNFLELIVDNGYPITTYFKYSLLNMFGIAPKFIPLSFFIAIILFIIKHLGDSEFIILWTSGVKKIKLWTPNSIGIVNNEDTHAFLEFVSNMQNIIKIKLVLNNIL